MLMVCESRLVDYLNMYNELRLEKHVFGFKCGTKQIVLSSDQFYLCCLRIGRVQT